jgi:uncharacterized membrane protein YhaH (DUF805 family)
VQSVKTCFKKYATFSGRASRSEYYYWMLFIFITSYFLSIIGILGLGNNSISGSGIFYDLFFLITILPIVSVTARRLHDINFNGLFSIIVFLLLAVICLGNIYAYAYISPHNRIGVAILFNIIIYYITIFIPLILFIKKGTTGDNRFGKDPLAENK